MPSINHLHSFTFWLTPRVSVTMTYTYFIRLVMFSLILIIMQMNYNDNVYLKPCQPIGKHIGSLWYNTYPFITDTFLKFLRESL